MNDIGVIHLKNGGFAIVDIADLGLVSAHKWHWNDYGGHPQANINVHKRGSVPINMGRFILNPPKELQCDHINGFTIDNRRHNLRPATMRQNQWNQGKRSPETSTSKYKGVHWCSYHNAWRAQIRVNKKKIYLGQFKDQESAAMAYNKAARIHWGEFARLNTLTNPEVSGEQKG